MYANANYKDQLLYQITLLWKYVFQSRFVDSKPKQWLNPWIFDIKSFISLSIYPYPPYDFWNENDFLHVVTNFPEPKKCVQLNDLCFTVLEVLGVLVRGISHLYKTRKRG